MAVYVAVWAIVYVLSLIELANVEQKLVNFFLGVAFVVLLLFIGTRYETGPDIFNYRTFFSQIPTLWEALTEYPKYAYIPVEPFYMFVNAACKSLGMSFNGFLLLFSFLFILPVFKVTRMYSAMPLFSVMIYFYYGYFSGFSVIRQVIAAAIFFYSIKFIIDRKLGRYLLGILLASCFHITALILFPMYFLASRTYKAINILLVVFLAVILRQFGVFAVLSSIISQILSLSPLSQLLLLKFTGYASTVSSFWGAITMEWLTLIIIVLFNRKAIEKATPHFNVFFNIFFIGIIMYAFFGAFGDFARILIYFKLAYIIVIPAMVMIFQDIKLRFFLISLFSLLVVLRVYISILADVQNPGVTTNRYLPYKSWILN